MGRRRRSISLRPVLQDVYFKFSPRGTEAGLHEYDTQLEDYSAAGAANVAALHEFREEGGGD